MIREQDRYEKTLTTIFKELDTIKVFTETIGTDNLNQDAFDNFADNQDFSDIGYFSFSIAPNGIVEYYHSDITDDNIIGHNFLEDPRESVRNAVNYAIDNDVIVITGPVNLLLGQQGITFRRAVYEDGVFKAIISLVVYYETLTEMLEYQASSVLDVGIYDIDNNLLFGNLPYSDNLMDLNNIQIDDVDWKIGMNISENHTNNLIAQNHFTLFIGNTFYLIAVSFAIGLYHRNRQLLKKQNYLIYYDNLTDLPNRRLLKKEIEQAINDNKPFYLGFGDLDNFKNLNDILGHSAGDKFLQDITERFNTIKDENFRIYRWGGDEFIFIIFTEHKDIAVLYLDEVYKVFEKPITIKETRFNALISIGVVQYPRHGLDMDDLVKHADIVMYDIKSQKRNTYGFFENRYLDNLQREIDFENKVSKYEISDYDVYLQPLIFTETNEVYGFEALSRLFDNENKLFNTGLLIKHLERNGDIPKLDKHVFDTLCTFSKKIKDSTGNDYNYSFNVSPVTLSAEFVSFIESKVKEHGVDPKNFTVEITESFNFKDINTSIKLLFKLRNLGFSIAMDDFGIGYSSLSYIAKLPLNVIKIDRFFISHYDEGQFERNLIYTINDISKSLNLDIVVEGIETSKQLEFIKKLQTRYYQGYLHSKPMSLEMLIDKLLNGF